MIRFPEKNPQFLIQSYQKFPEDAGASYAFYAIITASVNLFKARRHQSPVISAAKAINLVAAMVSILLLETALLAQFGGDDDPLFRQVMTGATGGAVCTIVIGMTIYDRYDNLYDLAGKQKVENFKNIDLQKFGRILKD